MASEDVIELGSSDDEVEPPPKKKKAIPNAMVHIPTKLHGVTIKPTTSKGTPRNDGLTVTKVSKFVNPLSNKNKSNGQAVQRNLTQNTGLITNKVPVTQGVNPINLFKKLNSQVVINKVPSVSNVVKNPIRITSPKTISNLPPSITVKRAPSVMPVIPTKPIRAIRPIKPVRQVVQMRNTPPLQIINKKKQRPRGRAKVANEVLTVDLDDDDTGSSTSSPQWYLRPEDEDKPTLEEENNKEPEKDKCVEITIEDSPVKPKAIKAVEEMLVTIEDSPVKPIPEKQAASESDEDDSAPKKSPQSKKKLDYPAEVEEKQVIEIQFEPMEVDESETKSENKELAETQTKPDEKDCADTESKIKDKEIIEIQSKPRDTEVIPSESKSKEHVIITMSDDIVEIEESPLKEPDSKITSTPKKNQNKPTVQFPEKKIDEYSAEYSEFHPVYRDFIKLCFQLENSEDMKKIVEKKVKTYYRQVPKDYTESEQFVDMVTSKILAMKAGPDKMYLYIKDIVDELNLQRKMAKTQPSKPEKEKADKAESDNFLYGEHSEFDSKRQRQIRKLEKTLKKLHRAIQKLEEQEVDFDDEEDSVYLLTERYKERMMRVHAKFCQLTNTKMPSEPRVLLDPRPGHPPGPAKRLEKWINKKVPIGTPLPFPDFHDVLRCVKEANEEDKLGWNDVDIMEEARDLFTRCGKKLQRRRQENEWRTAVSRISLDTDPAEENDDLRKKLEQNKQVAAKKEVEVFNKFADKQNQLKLEAEEIGDKEAEESPVESEEDEEETNDEESLENKHKRKERLRRLLQEKSKKNSDEKENESVEIINNSQTKDVTKEPTPTKDEVKSAEEEVKQNTDDDSIKEEKALVAAKVSNEQDKKESDKKGTEVGDTIQIDSDIDELHLLQKLYSENEVNSSTVDSSDSEAPISISDTLDSDNADKKSVISIENSSYSESEINKIETFEIDLEEETPKSKGNDNISIPKPEVVKGALDSTIEIECSENGVHKKQVQTNNDEYNESIEDILLASSDDEADKDGEKPRDISESVNNAISLDVPDNIENPGSIENPRSVETPRRFDVPENVENPGSVEDSGSIENPGSVENLTRLDVTVNVENPGSIENIGSIENPGSVENRRNLDVAENVENPGSIENPRSIENPGSVEEAVNLKDDNLSIGETVVGGDNNGDMEQTAMNSPLDNNMVIEYNSNGEISDNAGNINENMDISEDVNEAAEDVISLDADCAMQTDDVLDGDNFDNRKTDNMMSSNDNRLNDEIVPECVSLDDDSSACETVIENIGNESDSQGREVGPIENDMQGEDVETNGSDTANQDAENIQLHYPNPDEECVESHYQNQDAENIESDYHMQDSKNIDDDFQNRDADYDKSDYQNQGVENVECNYQDPDTGNVEFDDQDGENIESEYQNQDAENVEFDDQNEYEENIESDFQNQDANYTEFDSQNEDAGNSQSDWQNQDSENIVSDSQSQDGEKIDEVEQRLNNYTLEKEIQDGVVKVSTVSDGSCSNYIEQNVKDSASENIETTDDSMVVQDNDLESEVLNNETSIDRVAKDNVNDHLRESTLLEGITLQTTT